MGVVVSDRKELSRGVPKGYFLGLLLFVFYINDLIDCVKNIWNYMQMMVKSAILDETIAGHKSMQDYFRWDFGSMSHMDTGTQC